MLKYMSMREREMANYITIILWETSCKGTSSVLDFVETPGGNERVLTKVTLLGSRTTVSSSTFMWWFIMV
jgi:hypothetical protein